MFDVDCQPKGEHIMIIMNIMNMLPKKIFNSSHDKVDNRSLLQVKKLYWPALASPSFCSELSGFCL